MTNPDLVRVCPNPPSTSLTNIPRWSQAASILVIYSLTLYFSCTAQIGQVEVQRQQLRQYYQRFHLSSREAAQERLLAPGELLSYKRLLKVNELTVEIAPGAQAWQDFVQHADHDRLSLTIQQAQRFNDNLQASGHDQSSDPGRAANLRRRQQSRSNRTATQSNRGSSRHVVTDRYHKG